MTLYAHLHKEIAIGALAGCRLALPRHADGLAIIDPCRNSDAQLGVLAGASLSAAGGARIGDQHALAIAGWARATRHELTKNGLLHAAHLACTATGGTGLRRGTILHAASVAGFTGFETIDLDLLFSAEHCFLEGEIDRYLNIGAALGCTSTTLRAAHAATEEGLEDISEWGALTAESAERIAVATAIATNTGMTEAIICSARILITEHLVRLVHFLEANFGIGFLADIWVVLLRFGPVSFFDLCC